MSDINAYITVADNGFFVHIYAERDKGPDTSRMGVFTEREDALYFLSDSCAQLLERTPRKKPAKKVKP